MDINFWKESDKVIQEQMHDWSEKMFDEASGKADINSIMRYSPLIQMLSNELTGRFVKRTTVLALCIAAASFVVSCAALYVAYTSQTAGT